MYANADVGVDKWIYMHIYANLDIFYKKHCNEKINLRIISLKLMPKYKLYLERSACNIFFLPNDTDLAVFFLLLHTFWYSLCSFNPVIRVRETPPPTYTERGGGRDKGARSDTLISALTKFLSTVHRLWPQMLSYKISMETDNLGIPEVIIKVPAHCNHGNLYSSPYY